MVVIVGKEKAFSKPTVRIRSKDSITTNVVGTSVEESESSTKYLQAIIDGLEDELMVVDRDYRIIEANSAVLLKHGRRREKVIGRHCYDISHGLPETCRPPRHDCPIREVWETGKPARATHVHVYHVDGERQKGYLDIIASPICDSHGNITAVVELMRDVTEAKDLETRIAEAHQNLMALNAVATVVSRSLDLETVLNSALEKTLEIMKVNTGGIQLLDKEEQMLCYRAHRGLSKQYVQGVCCRLGEGIAGSVAQTGKAILIEDISRDPRAAYRKLIAAEGLRAFASVPLCSKEKVLGVLNIAGHGTRKFSPEDAQLLNSIATQIAIAVENAKLHQEVRSKEEIRGELLQDIFSIQEEERKRISRELHDETSQVLASLTASLEAAASMLPASENETRAILRKAQNLSINILGGLRNLIYELRPTLLDDLGLVAAIRWLVDNKVVAAGVAVNFKIIGKVRRLSAGLETILFRVLQEAVNNIVRHADAKSVDLSLYFRKYVIRVCVRDDGRGFDVEEAMISKDRPRGLGLMGMKERVELVNGALSIRSHPGSGGTEINIEIPLNKEGASGQDEDTGGR